MLEKIIVTDSEAKELIKEGVNRVGKIVGETIGVAGKNVLFSKEDMKDGKKRWYEITNDGTTIAQEIVLDNEIENLAAQVVISACDDTNRAVGDGTTTTAILTQAIFNEGYKQIDSKNTLVNNNKDVMKIKREIQESCKEAVKELEKQAKQLKTKEEVANIAIISVESKELGSLIAETFEKVKRSGAVLVEEGLAPEVTTETTDGIEIPYGFIDPMLLTNPKTNEAIFKDADILVTNEAIELLNQLEPILEKYVNETKKTKLVIVARAFNHIVRPVIRNSWLKTNLKVLAIQFPTSDFVMQDLCIAIGANFIDERSGMSIKDAIVEDFGKAEKVVVNDARSFIIKGKGDKKLIQERIAQLKDEESKEKSSKRKITMRKRIGSLEGGVGIITVGATTDTEREYIRKKIDDSVNATRAAIEDGIVLGGGLALKNVAKKMGKNILTKPLEAPYQRIQDNAGGNLKIGKDVIDPVKVTRVALENACSTASLLLTTNVVIADRRKKHLADELDKLVQYAEAEQKSIKDNG